MSLSTPILASLVAGAVLLSSAVAAEPVAFRNGPYVVRSVSFQSQGSTIVGSLFSPAGPPARHPAVVVLGPFGFVKEQAPTQYATRLARDGYVALVFDPRYSGESGGEPRRLESPAAKVQDVQAAIDLLQQQPEVDARGMGLLGICQGSSEMIAVAAQDKRIKSLALVSGQYIYPENIDGFFAGGGPTRLERIARGKAALEVYRSTGEVRYTAVVSATDKAAGLPWPPIHDWYQPWTTQKWLAPSRWENRYATMSDAEVWAFDVDDFAPRVTVPTLIVHGEMSDGNVEAAQHVHDRIAATDKRLLVLPGVFHTRFYDDPSVIDPAAAAASGWMSSYLGSQPHPRTTP